MAHVVKIISELKELSLSEVESSIPWVNYDAPRDECFMSTRPDTYTYGRGAGVRTYSPIPYTPLMEKIREIVNKATNTEYEACFSNRYVDEQKHLGWHADDSPSIDHSFGIAIVSFGAEREIWLREMTKEVSLGDSFNALLPEAKPIEKIPLQHGSLFVMPPGFQQTHQHRIPKHSAKVETRVSLTFRKLL